MNTGMDNLAIKILAQHERQSILAGVVISIRWFSRSILPPCSGVRARAGCLVRSHRYSNFKQSISISNAVRLRCRARQHIDYKLLPAYGTATGK